MDLRDEAHLLFEQESPRAFTLAVASIEELMKSFLCDTVWKQNLDPSTLRAELKGKEWPILTSHASKHRLFALFLLLSEARKGGRKALEETIETLKTTLTTDALTLKGKAEIETLVKALEGRRQDSLYVDVKKKDGRIKTPHTEITPAMCDDLLKRIDQFLPTLETNLKLSRNEYQKELRKNNIIGKT